MDFYERVKMLAKANGITIASLANKAGLTIDSYNSYRRHGNLPRADEAARIAAALNTTVEYLVTGTSPHTALNKDRLLEACQAITKACNVLTEAIKDM